MPAEIKRSVSIAGHRTSISLERPFWDALKEIACSEDVSVNELVRRIDGARDVEGNLSGAVRVYVLAHFRNKSAACAT
ncbi:MAG: ribbon-helix-helix domain-containing protein [Parvibaculum sp.]|jgi:predicted DNA-binding ribbon-helix-helix protein|uniref:ribbon-helix-helix domain-containing protein n=1 Tax=Parvibaculum sp. TaxID=2024848 RepID=UPI00284F5075|nr:ribbon-helix-helix domain-containing protein [Parvibaculum sp.]MDR3498129.1 ribbon-helix-helix domain-containing protein [Parvibaculum sp.]